jgi:hypothetical protein
VVFKGPPTHKEDVSILALNATLKLQRNETTHRGNDCLSFSKGNLKLFLPAKQNIERGHLQNHHCLLPEKCDDFIDAPNVIADTSFHRWRHAQRLMHASEIVEHE